MTTKPSIYLMIDFEWPSPFAPEHGKKARALHDAIVASDWIEEVVAASGGVGQGPSSSWIFKLENYNALDRLMRDSDDAVSQAYRDFFSMMPVVNDKIREEVLFL